MIVVQEDESIVLGLEQGTRWVFLTELTRDWEKEGEKEREKFTNEIFENIKMKKIQMLFFFFSSLNEGGKSNGGLFLMYGKSG